MGKAARNRRRREQLPEEVGASVHVVKELPKREHIAAIAQEHGVGEDEVEAILTLSYIDGSEAPPGKTCPGPVCVHEDGVIECVSCWQLASAHHGPDSTLRCDLVEPGRPGWTCGRCS